MPKRIQRKRSKGWRMPPNTVYVGRPTKWGNPHQVDRWCSAQKAVEKFRQMVDGNVWTPPNKWDIRRELRGKDLVCWCRLDQPCHADVLLDIANREPVK